MNFAHPNMLWLLLVIPPALVVFFWWSWRTRQRLIAQFIEARLLPTLTVGISPARQIIRLSAMTLAVICVILALARPQWGFDWQEAKQKGLDIVVAIDTSKSMLAEDIAPNRLARAKLAALDLMLQAKSDRLGLVAFAGSAFLQCPLTIDDAAFRQSVETLDVNIIPDGGTALADAIETAATAFKEGDNYKVLVLFTDGEDQDSGAVEAAKKAAESGMQIFTVGIGSAEGELLRIKDGKGRTDYVRDDQGNVVKSHLNEALLREIATETKGFYLPLRGAKTIDTLYKEGLAPLPKSEGKEKLVKQYRERFHWPLGIALLLLVVETFFPERKREPKPKLAPAALASPIPAAAIGLLCLLLLPGTIFGSAASALREYRDGKYDQAQKEYEQLLQRKKDDPRLRFNAGAAAYRNQQFDDAAKRFDEVLTAPDLKLQEQAYYNRGNTFFHLGERNQDPAKRTETWEKAVKDYESTLRLNPQDGDAKFNRDFVKQKLEELKQQQQNQPKQDKSDKNQDKDKQQQQQQQPNKDQKKDQDKKSDDQQNKSDQNQNKDASQKDQQAQQQKPDDKKQQDQQQASKSQEQKDKEAKEKQQQQEAQKQKEQQQAKAEPKENPDDKSEGEPQKTYAPGEMTPQQAQQLLDAQKNDETLLPIKPTEKPRQRTKTLRDW